MTDLFYLQDSRSNVGSRAMFWRAGGGYTTNLDEAESLLALINDQAPTLDSQGLAGAALAQPSPAPELPERGTQHRFSTNEQNCRHDFAGVWWNDNGETKTGRECRHCGFFVADVAEAAAEQAEAERPEVVGVRYEDGTILSAEDCGTALEVCAKVQTPLMTVAQHERIAASRWERAMDLMGEHVARISEKFKAERDAANKRADTLEHRMMGMMTRHFAEAWRNRDTQKALDGYLSAGIAQLEQERDAAQARVAELEMLLRKLSANGLMQFSTADEEKAVRAALSGAQAQHSVPEGFRELLEMLVASDLRKIRYAGAWRREVHNRASSILALLAAAPGNSVPQAWLDVQAERRRQVEAEGWTPQHDDEHADGQMAQAAGCYALHAGGIGTDWPDGRQNGSALFWPWDKDWWKPTTPRRDLVKACALALAEIERLDRVAASQGGPSDA